MKVEKTDRWEYKIFQLDAIRKKKGLTHKQIADQLNIHQSNVTKFFSGQNNPSVESMAKISKILDTDINLNENTGEVDMNEVNEIALLKLDLLIIQNRSKKIDDVLS